MPLTHFIFHFLNSFANLFYLYKTILNLFLLAWVLFASQPFLLLFTSISYDNTSLISNLLANFIWYYPNHTWILFVIQTISFSIQLYFIFIFQHLFLFISLSNLSRILFTIWIHCQIPLLTYHLFYFHKLNFINILNQIII